MSNGDGGQAADGLLNAEMREEIRKFLKEERRGLFITGTASIVTIVTLIGGFLAYVLTDLRDRSVAAAQAEIMSLRNNTFDPEISKFKDAVSDAKDQYSKESAKVAALIAVMERSTAQIEALAERARPLLEELEKAQGSLVFADKMVSVNSSMFQLGQRLTAMERLIETLGEGKEPQTTLQDLFPSEGPSEIAPDAPSVSENGEVGR